MWESQQVIENSFTVALKILPTLIQIYALREGKTEEEIVNMAYRYANLMAQHPTGKHFFTAVANGQN